jgi:hypothetical protein
VIEPIDEDERDRLLRELVVERFGRPLKRGEETPQVYARRRRVLCAALRDGVRKQQKEEA